MHDMGTFIVRPGTPGLPAGNFFGYIDREPVFSENRNLPFPHVRATYHVTQCVMRIEREDHPQMFTADNPHNMTDIDVTSLLAKGVISYDQYVVPDAPLRSPR
jgi:hypothetical protein